MASMIRGKLRPLLSYRQSHPLKEPIYSAFALQALQRRAVAISFALP